MEFQQNYLRFSQISEYFKSISLFLARLMMAYGFYEPALNKWRDISSVASWFETLGIPFPTLNAYMSATIELLGVGLLVLGLFTRAISLSLIVVMIVAIVTVHLPNGFSVSDNGFEIPLYFMLFLLIFFAHGAGKFSLDQIIFNKKD